MTCNPSLNEIPKLTDVVATGVALIAQANRVLFFPLFVEVDLWDDDDGMDGNNNQHQLTNKAPRQNNNRHAVVVCDCELGQLTAR